MPPSKPALQLSLRRGALHRTEKVYFAENTFLEDPKISGSYLTAKVSAVAMVAVVVTLMSVNPVTCELSPTTSTNKKTEDKNKVKEENKDKDKAKIKDKESNHTCHLVPTAPHLRIFLKLTTKENF